MKKFLLPLLAIMSVTSPAYSATLLSDSFDGETLGTPQPVLTNFDVLSGSIDIVGTNTFSIDCVGGVGKCLDLDGSQSAAPGVIQTKSAYSYSNGDKITLSFKASGNQRGAPADAFFAGFLFADNTTLQFAGPSLVSADPFSLFTYSFTATAAGSVKAYIGQGGTSDQQGVVVDDFLLTTTAVPEPSTWMMMLAGFGFIGAAMRRKRSAGLLATA